MSGAFSSTKADDEITVAAHKRKKRGRKPLPDHLPRIEIIHELPESERHCDHDGRRLTEIGEVIFEQLDIIPAKIQVCVISARNTLVTAANASRRRRCRRNRNSTCGYNAAVVENDLIHVGCMAHARRRFSDSVKGVTASANLNSLVETAKANALEPYACLRHLFRELPKADTVGAIEALLPGKLDADRIKIH